ncbi:MAG: hypothetical protein Q9209_002213 [Squamulea sp. 1 TL-2023]
MADFVGGHRGGSVVVACMPTFGLLLHPRKASNTYGLPDSTTHTKAGHRDRLQKNRIMLQSRGSQHGYQGPIIEGNASRERLKSLDENFAHNGVLVTTTLNIEEPKDGDEDSTSNKTSIPDLYGGHMV